MADELTELASRENSQSRMKQRRNPIHGTTTCILSRKWFKEILDGYHFGINCYSVSLKLPEQQVGKKKNSETPGKFESWNEVDEKKSVDLNESLFISSSIHAASYVYQKLNHASVSHFSSCINLHSYAQLSKRIQSFQLVS